MKASAELDLKNVFHTLYARRRIILLTVVVISALSAFLAASLPAIYRSSILILISPQRLPSSYVASTVTTTVEQRIRAATAEVLSRTTLEKVVRQFDLYPSASDTANIDARIEKLRKNIQIEVRNNDTFKLSFDNESPERAMLVTAHLGTIFIDENLQAREQQATGTSAFISAESERLRAELESHEGTINAFKAKYRNELPEQLDANLRTLEQLRAEQQSNQLRLSTLQERKANLETQLVDSRSTLPALAQWSKNGFAMQGLPLSQQLETRKLQLEELLTRYSDKHPDIVRLKGEIAALEAEVKLREAEAKNSKAPAVTVGNSLQQMTAKQIADVGVEINATRAANELLRGQIAAYQTRIDNTPVRAIELTKISRTYEITQKKYQDLLAKSFDSQLSQNMEKQQKGERFRLVDPAYLPETPVRPNRLAIVLIGLVAGLAAGGGLALLLENIDTSFKRGEELEGFVNAPLLATLPEIMTRGSVLARRRSQQIAALASVAILTVGLLLIRLFATSLPVF